MLFRDRHDAGKKLAGWVNKAPPQGAVVLALGHGGMPVGYELSRALGCPLDYLGVDPIPAPGNPELIIGAIAETSSEPVLQREMAGALGLSPDEVEQAVLHAPKRQRASARKLRGSRPLLPVANRDVFIVNDGLCQENCAMAAARYLRSQGARSVTFATPIGSVKTIETIRGEFDKVICLQKVLHFSSIAFWYESFHEVTDARVLAILEQAGPTKASESGNEISISDGWLHLPGKLVVPGDAKALVIFSHGIGGSRLSPRNAQVASILNEAGFATLLFDLLTPEEASRSTNVFDIPLLASRVVLATRSARRWVGAQMPIGYFGVGTGAAASLWAASQLGDEIFAIVSRSGRPDLAATALGLVSAPTLLIVGEKDEQLLELNRQCEQRLPSSQLVALRGLNHRLEAPTALDDVARLARRWFTNSLERSTAKAA